MGTAFTYQGQLKEAGQPYSGPADVTFRLFDAEAGGLQIGSDMELVLEPLCREDDGREIITWKFRPL